MNLPARLQPVARDLLQLTHADRKKVLGVFHKGKNNVTAQAPTRRSEVQTSTTVFEASMWQGPLPPPQQLERFNEIVPGAADRLIRMAEKQQDHRIETEKLVIKSQLTQSGRGQIFGLVIGLSGMALAAFLGYLDMAGPAAAVGAATVTGLAIAFIHGKAQERGSRKEKKNALSGESPRQS